MNSVVRFFLVVGLCVWPLLASAQRARKAQRLSRWNIPAANYSGICHIAADTFALVDDKSPIDGYHPFLLRLHPHTGKVTEARLLPFRAQPAQGEGERKRRAAADIEGVAYSRSAQRLYLASEAWHTIGEYTLQGAATGRTFLMPPIYKKENVVPNASFEALCFDSVNSRFWVTTEQPLLCDNGILRLQSFDSQLNPCEAYSYLPDRQRLKPRAHYAWGVSAITALPDGRLLVMEREASIPAKGIGATCRIHVYAVSPSAGTPIGQAGISAAPPLEKTLFYECTTRISPFKLNFANYEGMCLGPNLADGRHTLLLISDSQAGAGNSLYRLRDYLRVIIFD